jgi:hypothetical protein
MHIQALLVCKAWGCAKGSPVVGVVGVTQHFKSGKSASHKPFSTPSQLQRAGPRFELTVVEPAVYFCPNSNPCRHISEPNDRLAVVAIIVNFLEPSVCRCPFQVLLRRELNDRSDTPQLNSANIANTVARIARHSYLGTCAVGAMVHKTGHEWLCYLRRRPIPSFTKRRVCICLM